MAEATWTPTEQEKQIADFSVRLQHENLDEEAFLLNQVEVIASYLAQIRFLRSQVPCKLTGDRK